LEANACSQTLDELEDGLASAWQRAPAEPDFSPIAAGHDRLAQVVAEARAGLEDLQKADGHWVFDLEADATISAEYVLFEHFLGEIDQALENKIAVYLRAGQADHGGWPLYVGGDFNMSATVKAYFALKLVGDDPTPPMEPVARGHFGHGGSRRRARRREQRRPDIGRENRLAPGKRPYPAASASLCSAAAFAARSQRDARSGCRPHAQGHLSPRVRVKQGKRGKGVDAGDANVEQALGEGCAGLIE
jgi:Squalene-hopene cyclase N-terminal domain